MNAVDNEGIFICYKFNWAPIHFAAAYDHEEVISVLLSFNTDIDFARKKGILYSCCAHYTPLHVAVKFGFLDIVEFLLDKGAFVNKSDMILMSHIFL